MMGRKVGTVTYYLEPSLYILYIDFANFFSNFGKPSGATFAQGDFDYDGDVDNADFAKFFSNFGKVLAPPPVTTSSTFVTAMTTIKTKTSHVWQQIEPAIPLLK